MKNFFIIILMFIFIYDPPIQGIQLTNIILPFIYLYLIFNFKTTLRIIKNKQVFFVLTNLIFVLVYLLLVILVNKEPLNNLGTIILIIFKSFPFVIFFISYFFKKGKNIFQGVFSLSSIIVIFQGILAVIAFLFPAVQKVFVNQLLINSNSSIYQSLSGHRMYGLGLNLNYALPSYQSIMAILMLYFRKAQKKIYIWFIPIVIFSAIVNARTSIVIISIGLILLLIEKAENRIRYSSLFLIFLTLLVPLFINPISISTNNLTFRWIINGLNEIILFISGKGSEGYFGYFTSQNKYVVPNGWNLIFGSGTRIMSRSSLNGLQSDIGYVNDIWLGGLVYLFHVIYISILLLKNIYLYETKNNKSSFISCFLFIALAILNIKGVVFSYHPLMNVLLLFSLASAIELSKKGHQCYG